MKSKVIYPGTFDPITNGHLDIIKRAASIFNFLILAVANSKNKRTMFSLEERVCFVKEETKHLSNVYVEGFSGLIINFAKKHNSNVLIRSIRSISDFEYESRISNFNAVIGNNIETIFLVSSPKLSFISSSIIKEIFKHNGDISPFVPKSVMKFCCDKKNN